MSMMLSHILCIVLSGLAGIWIGRKTNLLSNFIKGGAAA